MLDMDQFQTWGRVVAALSLMASYIAWTADACLTYPRMGFWLENELDGLSLCLGLDQKDFL